jgi:hypothetical protein
MKDYIEDILQTLSIKNLAVRFGFWAAVIATAALLVGREKVIDLLQNNDFGFWGDALIVSLSYVSIALIAWAKLIFYYCLGSAAGLVIVAAALAMTYAPVVLVGSSLSLIVYCVIQRPLPQKSFYPQALLSSVYWFNRQDRDFPVAKFASYSKIPYQLFPVSCILLS